MTTNPSLVDKVSYIPGMSDHDTIPIFTINTRAKKNKAVLEPRVLPAFAITYFCNHCNIRFENTSKYVDTLTLFPKTWTKGHWPLDDLWPHVCWGHMCDSTQGSLCPSPMTIHQSMWIQWSILQNTTYILHTTYRMSDHIVSNWTQFRRDNKRKPFKIYLYRKANIEGLQSDLREISNDFINDSDLTSNSTEALWSEFKERVQTAVNNNVPTEMVSGNKSPPWINQES